MRSDLTTRTGGLHARNPLPTASVHSRYAAECYYHIGLTRMALDEFEAAIAALEKSVELQPAVGANRRALAEALEKSGRHESARLQLEALDALH